MRYLLRLAFLFILGNSCFAQSSTIAGKQAVMMVEMFKKYHFHSFSIDDKFSEYVFLDFINTLDPKHVYFTGVEVKKLSSYRFQLDDEINNQTFKFLELATGIYRVALNNTDSIISEISKSHFVYSEKDTISFGSRSNFSFADNRSDFKKRWNKWLKLQTLGYLFSPTDDIPYPFTSKTNVLLLKEPEIRKDVIDQERENIKQILTTPGGFENYVSSIFLNSIAHYFDPHSSYFSMEDNYEFLQGVSASIYSFGLSFDKNEHGEIIIKRLEPGGPAWKSGEMHKGDILVSMKLPNEKVLEMLSSNVYEVQQALELTNSDHCVFKIKRTNGQVDEVTLRKEKMEIEENTIKSYILKGEKKIGYILLPGFYTEWEDESGLGCANDVAKELVKLQKEKVDGIILDLRFNGGGSVKEAIELAGIFINEGPLGVMCSRNEKPFLLKDMNRGTIYNGPLMVMVNSLSASASEILVGTLQDYNRALIVGSTTYGKASGQVVLSNDTSLDVNAVSTTNKKSELGFVKISESKFYRVTGKTHQLKGVVPDIDFPDAFENKEYHESSYERAIPSDSISKKIYYTTLPALPIKTLLNKSKERVKKDSNFQRIQTLKDSLYFLLERDNEISLEIETFKKSQREIFEKSESLEKLIERPTSFYTVTNNKYDLEILKIDLNKKESNTALQKKIQQDIYIEESAKIMTDLITFENPKMK